MVKLSLIVPVYNVEDYLDECLKSIVNQDYDNYEVIVVNDGSTDKSLKIAKKYEKKYSKLIKVFDKENGGLSDARNFGIEKASGEYLFFIDSDDCVTSNCLSIVDKNLIDCDVLVFNILSGETIDKTIKLVANDSKIVNEKGRYIVGKPSAWNKICKKELFDKIKFPVGLYYEDLATMPKFAKSDIKIKFIDDALYFYRIREGSIMNKKGYTPKIDSIFEVLEQLKDYFNDTYMEEIEYLYIEHLLRGASLRYFDCGGCTEQLDRIVSIMKQKFPNWRKNKYFKNEKFKKKIMCYLFYNKYYSLIKLLRK